MDVNASQAVTARVVKQPCVFLTLFASAQLGLVAAALIAWTHPNISSFSSARISDESAAIQRSIFSAFTAKSIHNRFHTPESATIRFVSNAISAFGHEELSAKQLATAIVNESKIADLDPLLIAAVVKYESSFKTYARSSRGARGLMQVMPATEKALLGRVQTASLDPHERQLRLGAHYLAELHDRFRGNTYLSLIAYNWGPTNLSAALKSGHKLPAGPVRYAKKIMAQQASWNSAITTARPRVG